MAPKRSSSLKSRVAGEPPAKKLKQVPKYRNEPPKSSTRNPPTFNEAASDDNITDKEGLTGAGDNMHSWKGLDTSVKESHKVQRQLAKERRMAKPNGQLLSEAKLCWELARRKTLSKKDKQEYVAKLAATVQGKIQDLVFKHDASRIVQTIVSEGSPSEKEQVARELQGSYYRLAQARYSKFLVSKLIRHCPSHRTSILAEFHGKVIRSILHRETTDIIADAYELYATPGERNLLLKEFYGKEVELFDSEKLKDGGLRALLADDTTSESRRMRVLAAIKENLVTIFNNPDKGAVRHSIVHRVLWEYLSIIKQYTSQEEQAKLRQEIFESCQELLPDMAHTKDGSRAVREFVALGSAKDRKKILKVFKPHLEKMCTDDQAQLVLFTCLDAIDDTKVLLTSVIHDMVSLSSKFFASLSPTATSGSNHTAGRRSLLYLVVPRATRHFPPALIAAISETDSIISSTSKKDTDLRRKEIRAGASPGLLRFIEREAPALIRDPAGSLFVGELMLYADGDKSDAISALLGSISASPYPSTTAEVHPLDLPYCTRLFKTLVQGGHYSRTEMAVDRAPNFSAINFARILLTSVGKEKLVAMTHQDGTSFLIVEIIQRLLEDGTQEDIRILRDYFSKGAAQKVGAGREIRGADALMKKLAELDAV